MLTPLPRFSRIGLALLLVSCSEEDERACDVAAQSGCPSSLACEEVPGGAPACFAPVVLAGKVTSLSNGSAVAGARVVALDINGAPQSAVAVSTSDGSYWLRVPSPRKPDGAPVGSQVTLRADAAGFQSFPQGIRTSLPIDTSNPTKKEGKLVVASALTDIGLIPLPEGAGTGAIAGTVEVPKTHGGVLVVAETLDGRGTAAIADRDGDFIIFNLKEGPYRVRAYTKGVNHDLHEVTVEPGKTAKVALESNAKPTSSVAGKVELVNAPAGSGTSVILVVESTFNTSLARGDSPPGLRTPAPGVAPNVTGDFTIDGVPEGRYVVLAAFEDDALVRDPDPGIAGTQVLHQEVTSSASVVLPQSFKVTGALEMISPGASGATRVASAPTLSWEDDSSEDGYHVTVYDALGAAVWTHEEPRHTGTTPKVAYGGPLVPGMFYQLRVVSFRSRGPISLSEDLKGVFHYQP